MKLARQFGRRQLLRWSAAAGVGAAIARSKVFDGAWCGVAHAAPACATNRSVHVIAGNGSFAWFQLLWPHIDVAMTTDPSQQSTFAYNSYATPGTLYTPPGPDHPFFYAPSAPWMSGGVPRRPVTAMMCGRNETHTQTPTTPGALSSSASMLGAVAALQLASGASIPMLAVGPLNIGSAPGSPPVVRVRDADGVVALYASAASQGTLHAPADANRFAAAVHDLARLRPASQLATQASALNGYDRVAGRLGIDGAALLTPTTSDLASYGVTALATSSIGAAGQKHLSDFARALIVTAKAFKADLAQSVVIALGAGAASNDGFVDPHLAFAPGNAAVVSDTVKFVGLMLNAFYADLATSPDPVCTAVNLDTRTILTVHGDTPHDPLVATSWPDGTPGSSNWMYVMGGGYLHTGWFGAIHADGTVDGFDPQTGTSVPGQSSVATSAAAGAAVLYAVTMGNRALVQSYYGGPWISGLAV